MQDSWRSALIFLRMRALTGIFSPDSLSALEFFIYALGAGLSAAAAGFLVGLPSLRLKGDYLAIVTLGFGEIIRVALLNMDLPERYSGLLEFSTLTFFVCR